MNNDTSRKGWSSPAKISVMVLCAVLLIAAGALAAMKVTAAMKTEKGISDEKATQIALADAGYETSQVSNLRVHYDRDDFSSSYEIEFVADTFNYEYEIDAANGKIMEVSKDAICGQPSPSAGSSAVSGNGQTAAPDNCIGDEKAKEIALQSAGIDVASATFTKIKLERDDGLYVYDIEFVSGDFEYSFEIDAVSGTILEKSSESIYS